MRLVRQQSCIRRSIEISAINIIIEFCSIFITHRDVLTACIILSTFPRVFRASVFHIDRNSLHMQISSDIQGYQHGTRIVPSIARQYCG